MSRSRSRLGSRFGSKPKQAWVPNADDIAKLNARELGFRLMFIIFGRHPIAGDAEVRIGSATYTTGGASMAHRARLVWGGHGTVWKTRAGAERMLAKVKEAHRDTQQWQGYVLEVKTVCVR